MPEAEPEKQIETEVIIRAATLEEVGGFFTHVWKTIYHEGALPALLDWNRLSECDEFFVAEYDGAIIGTATLAVLKKEKPPTLDTLYVSPSHQGKGVGLRLCEIALQRFREAAKFPVVCDVTTSKMHGIIDRLTPELKALLKPDFSYRIYGDEWEAPNR